MAVTTSIRGAGASDPGLVRSNNEDRFHYDVDRGIYFVVDGVGGQAAGEKAADAAVKMLRARLERKTGAPEQRLREGITMANNEILRLAQEHPEWKGMACVLTAAIVEDGRASIGHVGDSRCYLLQGSRMRKLTHDHSPVGEREDANEISELEAMRHPRRNEVYRDVGTEEHSPLDADFIEIVEAPFERDCALLICSDGLTDLVPSAEIARVVKESPNADEAVRGLIAAALEAGGKDNVTVVLAEGERFARRPAPHASAAQQRSTSWLPVIAALVLGAGLAAAGMWYFRPTPPDLSPKVLSVASGGSIATVMEQARAGDTVQLAPGEYSENVRLKPGVHLRSRGRRGAIIRGTVAAENATSGSISGLHITSQAPSSMLLSGSTVDVVDNEIEGAGVEITGPSKARLAGNYLHDIPGAGIRVLAPAEPCLIHNVIVKTTGPAVDIGAGAHALLERNRFELNQGGPLRAGNDDLKNVIQIDNLIVPPPKPPKPPRVPSRRAAAQ